jgi:cytochrome c nitrite reductase small subunit
MKKLPPAWLTLAALAGLLAGVGFFTFGYAEGLSYFSADPVACKNCHIMNEQFDSWQKAGHHGHAQCVDCHLPNGFLDKYLAKAENGYHHSKGFTFQDFHEPVRIKGKNAKILQENCLRCHGELVHDLVVSAASVKGDVTCVHCHADVGHGPVR